MCDQLQLRNRSVGEDLCHGYILAQLGLQVQAVAFSGHQLNFSLTLINDLKETINILNVINLHFIITFLCPNLFTVRLITFFFRLRNQYKRWRMKMQEGY